MTAQSPIGLANAFISIARAIEDWNTVRLREALRLPPETPLDVLAELVSRLHHLETRTMDRIEQVLCNSRALPWLSMSGNLPEITRMLPAICEYVAARESAQQAELSMLTGGDEAASASAS